MKSIRTITLVAFAMLLTFSLSSSCADAQSQHQQPPPSGQEVFYQRIGPGPLVRSDMMSFIGFEEGLGGERVKGAPFSATISMETTQVLADGNRIQRTTTGTIARDSEGRTRRDMTLAAIGPWTTSGQPPHVIFINDVVSGMQYILDTNQEIAHEVRLRMVRRLARRGVRLSVKPGNEQRDMEKISLGARKINGVMARGTRYTRTIPAGQIGNEKPIVITTVRWYSPELRLFVMTKRDDPLQGNTVSELTHIRLRAPAETLFQVPSNYTVRKGGVAIMRRGISVRVAPSPPNAPGPPPPPN